MRKRCNFNLPKPCRIYRNGKLKYVIYPDLSRFKKACLNCPYLLHKDNRYYCKIKDKEFMFKFYEVDVSRKRNVLLTVGSIPGRLRSHSLLVEIESYLEKHKKKSKRCRG